MPVGMVRAQAVVMGEKVYIGGGGTELSEGRNQVFQYNPFQNEWSHLPPHHMVGFAMAQFTGSLITVGGMIQNNSVCGKVYRFKDKSQKWEEFLKPMPTGRAHLAVATTQSAIVASGGVTDVRDDKPVACATVEVFSSETSQWYTAEPLPVPCWGKTSAIIADTWYLLGGTGTAGKSITGVLYAPLATLVQNSLAVRKFASPASHMSVWKTLPDTPLKNSAAASLNGNLLAVGGKRDKTSHAVHVFFPLTNSWVRVTTGDLPEPHYNCTAVQLSSNQLLVVGGRDNQNKITKTLFLGSITL